MEKRIKVLLVVLLIIIASVSIYVYLISVGVQEITGQEKTGILQYAEPISDNLLIGYNEGNYTMLSRDFDEQMKNSLTEDVFLQNRELVTSKIGTYISRETPTVLKQGPFIIVIYSAEFEGENGVQVRVVFLEYGDKNLVSGLWFNSPKLRE